MEEKVAPTATDIFMLERLIEFSMRQRVLVLMATALLVFAGVWSALRLSIDAVPDITNVQVQVNTAVPPRARGDRTVGHISRRNGHGWTAPHGRVAFPVEVRSFAGHHDL